ncbi:Hypothetical_protein [Hexamita inflata]|uniref:Hypothetical_protein n=1 Tax=Hexamita inflata TaxID=28002 RepID=A0AA86U5P7_9EUKA|nr:Hypothetical protein HINF_LOCUS29579 [Hexamita inflata]
MVGITTIASLPPDQRPSIPQYRALSQNSRKYRYVYVTTLSRPPSCVFVNQDSRRISIVNNQSLLRYYRSKSGRDPQCRSNIAAELELKCGDALAHERSKLQSFEHYRSISVHV